MKIKKYLSVGIGLLEGMENKKHHHTANGVYDSILALEEALEQKGFLYTEEIIDTAPKGTLNLTITDKNENGLVAQVKIFSMESTDTLATFNKVNGKIDLIRSYTKPSGQLSIDLPVINAQAQNYFVEISKGSEYDIVNFEVTITANKEISAAQTLTRMINIQTAGWHAGDLHHHSIYSSPVHGGTDDVIETPQEVAYSMQAAGLTYGALSDHHNIFNHAEWQKTLSSDFTPIISKEISTSNGHVMSLNVPIDVIYDIPRGERRTETFLREEFIRITNEIKAHNGLAQINHPRDLSTAISLPPEFTDMVEIFETMEIWNGSNPMWTGTTNHAAYLLWLGLLEEGRYIPATSGSDTHNTFANDYNRILEKINWILNTAEPIATTLSAELQSELTYLACLQDKTADFLEKWAEDSLGSGCVRTYIHLKEDESLNPDNILNKLRQGNSFLTNGPILIPTINGHIPGETVCTPTSKVTIDLQLTANKPLDALRIYSNGGRCTHIPLENKGTAGNKYFDYSQQLKDFDVQDAKWLFFVAVSDCNNLAITNPIFITQEEA